MTTSQGILTCLPGDILGLLCVHYHCIALIRLLSRHYYNKTKQLFTSYQLTQPIALSELCRFIAKIDAVLSSHIFSGYDIKWPNNSEAFCDETRRIDRRLRQLGTEPILTSCHKEHCGYCMRMDTSVQGRIDGYLPQGHLVFQYSLSPHGSEWYIPNLACLSTCKAMELGDIANKSYSEHSTTYVIVDSATFHAIMRMRGVTKTPKKLARKNKIAYELSWRRGQHHHEYECLNGGEAKLVVYDVRC